MSWNIKTPGDYINGPLTVAGSAAITGDLTVDTSTLYVSSSTDKVGIGTTSLSNEKLTVAGNISANAWLGRANISAPAGDCSIFRSADNTLAFGIASSTAMTLNSTGLGIGASPSAKLQVSNGASVDSGLFTGLIIGGSGSGSARTASFIKDTTTPYNLIVSVQDFTGGTTGSFIVRNGSTDQFRIDASGNVGIGVTPSAWATYKAVSVGGIGASVFGLGSSQGGLVQGAYYSNLSGSGWAYTATSQVPAYYLQINGEHRFHNAISGTAGAQITAWTQAMTLDASGNLLVGKTALSSATAGIQLEAVGAVTSTRSAGAAAYFNRLTSDGFLVLIGRESSIVGDISVTTTGTTFNSTSDYRLKEAVQPLVGGLARVSALKPSVYKWKANGSAGEGFLAHELAEVVPAAVTGEKDAVNADGSIKAQSIDMSRVVPILVAAIQELTARLQTLEAR